MSPGTLVKCLLQDSKGGYLQQIPSAWHRQPLSNHLPESTPQECASSSCDCYGPLNLSVVLVRVLRYEVGESVCTHVPLGQERGKG